MNVDGVGELDTVLKAIKTEDSTYADCLESWKTCLEEKGKSISLKDFDKFWVNNYIRYDTCSNQDKRQAGRKCNTEVGIKKDIWNFDNSILDDLKAFLLFLSK
ncbi:MAG: hypothetical protein J0647_11215 [Campylobacteraceae bacterium]|nr:hypothetical protein [Campylobacteraceae bacterium]